MVAKELGLAEQTLRNWVKMAAAGKLAVAAIKVVTPEQMDLSRLRTENVRLKREGKILKKQRELSLAEMCTILDVSVSGYQSRKRWQLDCKRLSETQMLTLIQSIHAELRGSAVV